MKHRYLIAAMLATALHTHTASAHEDLRLQAWLASAKPEVSAPYEQSQILAQLANIWAELKNPERSKALFDRSHTAAAGVHEAYVRDLLTGHLANELASGLAFDQALAKMNDIQDTEVWVKTAWKLVGKLAKAGKVDEAKALLKTTEKRSQAVREPVLRSELLSGTGASYRYIDKAHGENLVYESYGIAQMLPDPYERALMFNEAGAHLMDIGHRELALDVFTQVEQLVKEIKKPLHQAKALAMLGGEQAEKNLRDRAAEALDKAVAIANKLPKGEDKNAVLSEIARNYGQSYRYAEGVKVAKSIPDAYHRVEGYIRVAKNQYRQGEYKPALALLDLAEKDAAKVTNPYQQATLLRKLASERLMTKQQDHAKQLLTRAEALLPRQG